LRLTYEAVDYWNACRKSGREWEIRYDETILRQASAFIRFLRTGEMNFTPMHAEDYCFARAFGLIRMEEGAKRWSQLAGHETDRLSEMEIALETAHARNVVESKDHRVDQAIRMYYRSMGWPITVQNMDVANKSWPEFGRFLADAPELARSSD
ncbi:MAG: hypothetical protein ACREBW_04575, partial [Candidatus Micrarchaeaceae archaeon]